MRNSYSRSVFSAGWFRLFLGVARRRPDRAIVVAYWYLTGRRLRAQNRLRYAVTRLPDFYERWIGVVERREVDELLAIKNCRSDHPTFSVLIWVSAWTSAATLADTIESVRAQVGPVENLVVVGDLPAAFKARRNETYVSAAGLNMISVWLFALGAAQGDFVIILPPDAVLPPWSLARYAEAARERPGFAILYGDEDMIDDRGRRSQPWFKPLWNAELILAQDYVSHACAIARPLVQAAAATAGNLTDNPGYALVLASAAQTDAEIGHITHVLCHMRGARTQDDADANLRVVTKYVEPRCATAEVGPFGTVRVHWPLPSPAPSVTIIIPTRDRVDLLEACIGSLLRETDYPDFDIVVVDNGSDEPQTHAWFEAITARTNVSVLRYDYPYNYSAINNFAVTRARGQFLCLLNNDTEIIDRKWLNELMRYAVRPEIGAVGAKLLYGDRTVQHAGVVMGLGNAAGHAHRGLRDDQFGYFALAHCAHYASAVTAACLVVDRRKFTAVGGLDEMHLQIAYNDIDFCLKLARAGWRNVYAPQAVLIHHESKSRGLDMSPQHFERYRLERTVLQERWNTDTVVDPMHHPRLDRASEAYRIRF